MIEDRLGWIDYDERGEGLTLVLVPGSCSTGAAWRSVMARWQDRYRCVTTSLLRYGRTIERRSAHTADMAYEAEMLEAVVRRVAGPVHLVGHSLGGTTALAVGAEPHRHRTAGARVAASLRRAGPLLGFPRDDRDLFRRPLRAWPRNVRDYAITITTVNILGWLCVYSFHLSQACFGKVEVPTLVMRGGMDHPAMKRATEPLAECMASSLVTAPAAAHFMILTHAKAVADEIEQHVRNFLRLRVGHADVQVTPRTPMGKEASGECNGAS